MQPSERSKRSSEAQAFAGLIVRERNPENLEFPFSALNSFVTSNEQFFVRSHFGVPKLERDAWRLIIEGRVRQRREIAYDELVQIPSRTVTMTLECAGNSRIFLSRRSAAYNGSSARWATQNGLACLWPPCLSEQE